MAKERVGNYVEVKKGDVDFALRKFKQILKADRLFYFMQRKQFFIKPSLIKRDAINASKMRQKRENNNGI